MTKAGLKFRRSVYYTLAFVMLIWAIKIIEFAIGTDFGDYGILPRTLSGSVGIFTAPLIHGDMYHLLANTFPILFLGIGLFYFYDRIALVVILLIYFMSGFWVWVAAREAYHIGASGLVYGMLTFLLLSGFLRRDPPSLAISFIVLFLYGGSFITGALPVDSAVSWESHLMGGIAGIFCAIYFRAYKNPRKQQVEILDAPLEIESSMPEYIYHYKEAENNSTEVVENKEDAKPIAFVYRVNSPYNTSDKGTNP